MPKIHETLRDPDAKRDLNRELFDRIARRYNVITRILSLGRDASWKRALVKRLPEPDPQVCLDLATGTGDIAALLSERYPSATIRALDLSTEMIALARRRLPGHRHEFTCGDIDRLPYPDESADLITGGYALRNIPDLSRGLSQIHRVLKPGGSAFFLEFVQPPSGVKRILHHLLLNTWGTLVGLVLHFRPSTYRYIPQSLTHYPSGMALQCLIRKAGFEVLGRKPHLFGVMERIELRKPSGGLPDGMHPAT